MKERSDAWENNERDIQAAFTKMQIKTRTIVSDNFASFVLAAPEDAKCNIGPMTVTVLPNGNIVVTGDYEPCIFARYSGSHWLGAIDWIGRYSSPSEYVSEKAAIGMGHSMWEFEKEQARIEILELRRAKDISREVARAMWDAAYGEPLVAEANLIQEMWENEEFVELGEYQFMIPSNALIAGHAALHRLNELLLEEENQFVTPSGERLELLQDDRTRIVTMKDGKQSSVVATLDNQGCWIVHCASEDARVVLDMIESLKEEE